MAGGAVQQVRSVAFLLGTDRVQRTPVRGLERAGQQAQKTIRPRQLHQAAQGALLVRHRHIDQHSRHRVLAGLAVNAFLERGGRIPGFRFDSADQDVSKGVAQQEARRDVDFHVAVTVMVAFDKGRGALVEDGIAFPALQPSFVEGEEHAFPVQFQGGQPTARPGDVRRRQVFAAGATEPREYHDFFQLVHGNEAIDHGQRPGGAGSR